MLFIPLLVALHSTPRVLAQKNMSTAYLKIPAASKVSKAWYPYEAEGPGIEKKNDGNPTWNRSLFDCGYLADASDSDSDFVATDNRDEDISLCDGENNLKTTAIAGKEKCYDNDDSDYNKVFFEDTHE